MNAILVSVGYDDYLSLTLPRNLHHFEKIVVVTTEEDWRTRLSIDRVDNASYLCTDAFYRHGASFNKGLGLEEGLDVLGRQGWICHFDSDCLLPTQMDLAGIEMGHLYVARRRMCLDPNEYRGQEDWSEWPLFNEKDPFDCGCFQLFHADDPVLAQRPWYPTHWRHAGGCDTDFNAKWPADRRHYLPFEVLHLGQPYVNWHGRQTVRLDGIIPEGAAEARLRTEEMQRARVKFGYETEKLAKGD